MLHHLRLLKHLWSERTALNRVPSAAADTRALRKLDGAALQRIFNDAAIAQEWAETSAELDRIARIEDLKTDGVNPGDRRAIYHLVRALSAKRILEIGTNVGASTLSIASALKKNIGAAPPAGAGIVTVDIRDVNDAPNAYWKLGKLPHAPRDNIAAIGMGPLVTFETTTSLQYLDRCADSFDFIFLDGDHSAAAVYQEITRALKLLRPGGTILLHDFFPHHRPLWSNNAVIVGPQMGANRLRREGATLAVLPLGRLPWPTKLGSNITSLALVTAG